MPNSIKTEFHIHTRYSSDSMLCGPMLMFMCRLKGLRCIAITDHNEVKGALKYKEKLEKKGIHVIIGEEIFTTEGEIIGLFLNERISPGLSPEDTVQEIKKQGGLVYIPHPYDEKRYKTVLKPEALERIIDSVDIIECHNGRNISEDFSKKQREICGKYGKAPSIGSDAHTFFEIGRNTCMLSSVQREKLAEALLRAEFSPKKCLWLSHKVTLGVRIIKKIGR